MEQIPLDNKQLSALRRAAEAARDRNPQCRKDSNRSLILWVLAVVLIALMIRSFIAEPIQVVGESMIPTLQNSERMLTEKLTYAFSDPRRGDVVVVDYPGYTEHCVKRVVGLPGDTVEVLGGFVYINGQQLDESDYWNGIIIGDMAPVTVPEKHIFVMGDNRNNSTDSRAYWVGCIPYEHIVGRSPSVIWPLSRCRSLTGVQYTHG